MSNKKGPYLLKFWGRDAEALYNDSFFKHVLSDTALSSLDDKGSYYVWFDSEFNLQVVEYNMEQLIQKNNWWYVSTRYIQGYDDCGRMVRTDARTVALMTFVLPDGSKHDYEYDFGYGYPAESALYMFEDGNYACDCNRSLFLRSVGVDIEEMDCGDEIKTEGLITIYMD